MACSASNSSPTRSADYPFTQHHDGTWYYRLDTLNLANGASNPNIFLGTPTRSIDERARLR